MLHWRWWPTVGHSLEVVDSPGERRGCHADCIVSSTSLTLYRSLAFHCATMRHVVFSCARGHSFMRRCSHVYHPESHHRHLPRSCSLHIWGGQSLMMGRSEGGSHLYLCHRWQQENRGSAVFIIYQCSSKIYNTEFSLSEILSVKEVSPVSYPRRMEDCTQPSPSLVPALRSLSVRRMICSYRNDPDGRRTLTSDLFCFSRWRLGCVSKRRESAGIASPPCRLRCFRPSVLARQLRNDSAWVSTRQPLTDGTNEQLTRVSRVCLFLPSTLKCVDEAESGSEGCRMQSAVKGLFSS